MPRPEYDRQKVLQWYTSLQATLAEANIDINSPKDLARVKVYHFNERKDTKAPGDQTMFDDEKMPAFIPKKFNGNREVDGYVVPKPHMPGKDLQDELDQALKDNLDANRALVNGVALLKNAYNSKNAGSVEEAKRNLETYQADVYSTFDEFRKKGNAAFQDYYQWMYANQTVFDPERDYEQIEELYHDAMEGRLYVNPLNSNPEDRWQIVVTGNGSASNISRVGAQEKVNTVDITSILSAIDTIKTNGTPTNTLKPLCDAIEPLLADFEAEHGLIGGPDSARTMEVGAPPAAVPKPGFGSWMKRIFSFGIANGDFKRYDAYQNRLTEYNAQRAEVKEHNTRIYEKALQFANTYHKELGIEGPEGMMNPGTVENNRMRMHNAEFVMGEERPEKEIYNESLNTVMIRHAQIMENAIAENPDIIDPNGNIDIEKNELYWNDKKELILPVVQHDRDKAYEGFEEAKNKYEEQVAKERDGNELGQMVKNSASNVRNNDIADLQQEFVVRKNARKNIANANDKIDFAETRLLLKGLTKKEAENTMKKWTSASVDDRIKQIGTLFGAKPNNAWNIGIGMLATCLTRNQEFNHNGTERDFSKLKTDTLILEDLGKLLDIAEHPEKAEANREFLNELKQLYANDEITPERLVDSAASILATHEVFNGSKEAKELGTGLYMCAQLAYRYSKSEKNPDGVDFEKDYKVQGGQNRTLSDKDQRQRLFELGKECYEINSIVATNKRAVAEREEIKENMKKGTLDVEAPELTAKRDTNLDLAKEPRLFH